MTQTVTGSLTQTVSGGITTTAPKVTVVTPSHSEIAATSAWKTGPTSLQAYNFAFAAYTSQVQVGANRDAVFATQTQVAGLNVATYGLSQTITGVKFEDVTGPKIDNMGVYIKSAATRIINAAIHLFP